MSEPFIDTNVIIRLLTGDDPVKRNEAAALFQAVEEGRIAVAAPESVIADAVYVLSSPRLYNLPRAQVAALLSPLVRLPGFKLPNRRALLAALERYAASYLGFGDALIVASMEQAGSKVVVSYDADFDKIQGVTRHTPSALL